MKENLLDFFELELKQKFAEIGVKSFRASQILQHIYDGKNFNEIKNIPQSELALIDEHFNYECASIVKEQVSKDGTIKYAIKLNDGNIIEAVAMNYKYGNTVCISSQVGCAMGCKFCASTLNGKIRNLTAGEMLAEICLVNNKLGGTKSERKITNIVLMGCGEPLDNYDNVAKFIRLVNDEKYLNISQRNISLSTCGIVENIYKLADDNFKINLTISLHAPNDEIRKKIMPIARKYSVASVLKACDYYFNATHRRIYFEYTLCADINNSDNCAKELSNLLRGKVCHINVINLNSVDERHLKGVSGKDAQKFVDTLLANGSSATLRRTLGADIDGACGQLRKKIMEEL